MPTSANRMALTGMLDKTLEKVLGTAAVGGGRLSWGQRATGEAMAMREGGKWHSNEVPTPAEFFSRLYLSTFFTPYVKEKNSIKNSMQDHSTDASTFFQLL